MSKDGDWGEELACFPPPSASTFTGVTLSNVLAFVYTPPLMNTTVPADPRLRKRAIAVVSITLLVGFVSLSFLQGFLREMEALATTSPQLAFEKLNPVRNAVWGVTLFSATALGVLLGYAAFSVYRAGQWPPPRWRVVWDTPIRTGRQATVVAVFMLLLALAALVYGAVIVSLSEPEPEEEIEVPMEEV